MKEYLEALKKYDCFHGRTRRKEYWIFWLYDSLIMLLLIISAFVYGYIIGDAAMVVIFALLLLYLLFTVIPRWAAAVRRLHDTGRSGWWLLTGLIPLSFGIVPLILLAQKSEPGQNKYDAK